MKTNVSIIVPIYNEINLIERFINKLKSTFDNVESKFIFIDDGSDDGTQKWLEKNIPIIFENKNYKLIILKKNKGKGYAVQKGLEHIVGSYTIFIDSDLEYDPVDALGLYDIVRKNDNITALFGSRYIGGKLQLRRHFLNDIAVRINTWIFNLLFNQSITDLHSGTKLIENKLLKKLNLTLNGFGHEIDISTQISKNDINIYETGISYIERTFEEGKKITVIDGLLSYFFLFRARFLQNDSYTTVSMLYAFSMMTLIGTFFGMGIGKVLITLTFSFVGLLNAIHRKIFSLSFIFLSIYLGSLFSQGNGRIFPILLFYFISLWLTKKITKKYSKKNIKSFINYFI